MVLLARALAGLGRRRDQGGPRRTTRRRSTISRPPSSRRSWRLPTSSWGVPTVCSLLGAMRPGHMVTVTPSGTRSHAPGPQPDRTRTQRVDGETTRGRARGGRLALSSTVGGAPESNWDVSRYVKKGSDDQPAIINRRSTPRLDAEAYDCVVRLGRGATDAPRREESSVARWRRRASVYFVGMRLQRALVVLERQPAGWNFEPNARAGVELKCAVDFRRRRCIRASNSCMRLGSARCRVDHCRSAFARAGTPPRERSEPPICPTPQRRVTHAMRA